MAHSAPFHCIQLLTWRQVATTCPEFTSGGNYLKLGSKAPLLVPNLLREV
jgi:hypothetical protein